MTLHHPVHDAPHAERGFVASLPRRVARRVVFGTIIGLCGVIVVVSLLALSRPPARIDYGMSFSSSYAKELGLDWRETYLAILDDLKVRRFRLMAHWPTVEPQRDVYDFSELRFQLDEAEKRGAQAIVVLGRRTPRWPECHIPGWVGDMEWEEQKTELRQVVERTVEEFKGHPAVALWQVENEPYLGVFADEHCGALDEEFLAEEVALVKRLDPTRDILVTDSGNLGIWWKPYRMGDRFGTSIYIYLWNPEIGPFKSYLPPTWYRAKLRMMELLFGQKESYLIELSIEPWLTKPVVDTPLDIQFERMDLEKFEEILEYAERTHFEEQYLWGAEWWYWLKGQGHSEFWEKGREIFVEEG